MKILSIVFLSLFLALLISCEDSTAPTENLTSITITGKVNNIKGVTITDNMKVYVFWGVVSGSPDYTYVWGKGNIDKDNLTFSIKLNEKPPKEALNNEVLGVGQIILLNDSELQNGKLPSDFNREKFVGMAGWYGVIYKTESNINSAIDWEKKFEKGYSTGIGVESDGFDSFVPIVSDSIKIIIDDLKNIKIVNWS